MSNSFHKWIQYTTETIVCFHIFPPLWPLERGNGAIVPAWGMHGQCVWFIWLIISNYIMCPPMVGLQGCNTKKQIVWEMKSVALIWPIFCHQKSIICIWNGWWPGIVFPALRLGRTLQPRHAFISFELQVKEKKNNQTMRKWSKPFKAIKRTAVNRMSMPWNVWKKSTRRVA